MSNTKEVLAKVYEAIASKKGENVTVLDVQKISTFTDFFVICDGDNRKQIQAICDAIREKLKNEVRLSPAHLEGYEGAEWILIDYIDFVVHIFSEKARNFYKLERLWSDGIELEPQALIA